MLDSLLSTPCFLCSKYTIKPQNCVLKRNAHQGSQRVFHRQSPHMPRVMAQLPQKRNKKHPQVSSTMSAVCICPMTKKRLQKNNTSRKQQETWSTTTLYLNVQHHRCRISISRRACTPARGALPTLEYHTQKTRGLISGEPTARFSPKFVFDGRSNFGTRTTCSRVQCAFKGQTMFLVRVRCRGSTPQPHPVSQWAWACSLRCRDMKTSPSWTCVACTRTCNRARPTPMSRLRARACTCTVLCFPAPSLLHGVPPGICHGCRRQQNKPGALVDSAEHPP